MATAKRAKLPLVTAIAAAVRSVPRGRVSTYGAIAKAAGYPRCSRHVSRVFHKVPGLPWHRILGSGGVIRTPGEWAMEQRFRLESEGVLVRGKRVSLRQYEHVFAGRRTPAQVKSPARKR